MSLSLPTQSLLHVRPPPGLLQLLSEPKRPWCHIAMGFVTDLLVLMVTPNPCTIPLVKLPPAKEAAELITRVFRYHGLPGGAGWRRPTVHLSPLESLLIGASARLSTGIHPQSSGQAERANQQLETALPCMAPEKPSSWSRQ